MFSKKKQLKDPKALKRSTNPEVSNQRNSSNSSSTNPPQKSAKRSGLFGPFSKPPTIIRANEHSHNAKKRRPPRPPPPKFNTSGCATAFCLDPPSYEEVLKADAKANHQKRPAPPLPKTRHSVSKSKNEPILIDFDANNDASQTTTPATFQSQEFKELEHVFSDWAISDPSAPVNKNINVTRALEPSRENGNFNLLDDDIYITGSEFLSLQMNSVEQTSQQTIERPIPLPRSSLSLSTSRASNINNVNTSARNWENSVGNGHSLESCFEHPPSLPPRPLTRKSLREERKSESPIVPPKPQSYSDVSQGLDVDLSLQRSEPHGIALFDYTASQNDELTFKMNDTIVLIHRIDKDWFYGCRGEHEGMFPRSFIQVVIPLPDDPEFQTESDIVISGPRCLAMFDYVSVSDEELSFHVGNMLTLLARINEHWLMAEYKGKSGLIPANYVRILEDLPTNGSSICEATVLHDFKAEMVTELDCKTGDHVTIIAPIDKDWVKAHNGTRIGIIPWTYLDFSI